MVPLHVEESEGFCGQNSVQGCLRQDGSANGYEYHDMLALQARGLSRGAGAWRTQ